MLSKDRLLHPATIIALIALMVALSGVGYAATKIGTAQLKNNAVTTPKIKNSAVTTAKVRNGAVNSAKLAAGAVRAADLGSAAVGTSALANDAVTAAKIAGGAVGSQALGTDSVTGPKLANGSVTTDKIGPNAVTSAKIAGSTITAANIAPGQVVEGKGQLVSARLVQATSAPAAALLTAPGYASVTVACSATNVPTLEITNTSGGELNVGLTLAIAASSSDASHEILAPGATASVPNLGVGGVENVTAQMATTAGSVATANFALTGTATGCVASGQAIG